MMQMFPDPDLAEVLCRDRHHRLDMHRWLDDAAPRRRSGREPGTPSRIRRRFSRSALER